MSIIAKLQAAAPIKSVTEVVPGIESLGPITIRELNFSERQEYSKRCGKSLVAGVVYVLSQCVTGLEALTETELNSLDQDVIDSLSRRIFVISGLADDAVGEAEGN